MVAQLLANAGSANVGDWNQVEIRQNGEATQFLVNGNLLGTVTVGGVDGVHAGLAAIGKGTFHFRKIVRTVG